MMREFAGPDELAEALADYAVAALRDRLARDGVAALAVSGGSTPLRFFRALSRKVLDWRAVGLTLVDDRWVGVSSPRSNAALVHANLLQGPAAAANFLPLVNDSATPEEGRAAIEAAIAALPLPFAVVVLGMGADGHTASFFPGGDRLAEALSPARGQLVESVRSEAAVEPRITLTLPVLLAAEHIALHIQGSAKREVLAAALQPGPVEAMPIRAVLTHHPEVFWCP
jgi:6-phosphogluconolactonase